MLLEPARIRRFDVEDGRKISDLQLLAKLQHFGAATGLLDFTWSALVALWFATQSPSGLLCDGKLFIVDTDNTIDIASVPSDENEQNVETVFQGRIILLHAYCIGNRFGAVKQCREFFGNVVCLF